MRIDGKDGLMKKIYTGKSLDELKALAISEIKELGVDEADIKITVVEEPVKKLFGKKGDPEIVARMQALADRNIARYGLMGEERSDDSPVPEQAEERHNVI